MWFDKRLCLSLSNQIASPPVLAGENTSVLPAAVRGNVDVCHCPVESHGALRECLPKLLPKPENCRHCIIHTAAAIVYQHAVTSCVCHHLAQLGATVSSSSRDAVWFSCIMTWWKLPRRVTCYGAVVWFQLDRRALLLSEPQASFIYFFSCWQGSNHSAS